MSETTPLTLLRVAELATEAGVPDGVFNVVTGSGAGCGAALTSHPQVAKVSFTGSTATGKQIARVAADRQPLIDAANAKKGKRMAEKLAEEFIAAYNNEGAAIKKKQDTYKMAEANKAFAHYRW